QRRLRAPPERVRLAQRLLGSSEIAEAEPHLAERVEPVAQRPCRPVRREFVGRLQELLFGGGEPAHQALDLCPVDTAHAPEAADRLALAPPMRGLGPPAGSAVIRRGAARRAPP